MKIVRKICQRSLLEIEPGEIFGRFFLQSLLISIEMLYDFLTENIDHIPRISYRTSLKSKVFDKMLNEFKLKFMTNSGQIFAGI